MDSNRCPRILGIQVGLEMVGQVMGLINGNIPGHHKMELDEDLRPRAPGLQVMEPGIDAGVLADNLLDPLFILFRNTVIDKIGKMTVS